MRLETMYVTNAIGNNARDTRDGMDTSDESMAAREKRGRVDALHLVCVADKDVRAKHAQWRNPRMSDKWSAAEAFPLGGVDAAISAWATAQCNQYLGRELSIAGEKQRMAKVCTATDRESGTLSKLEVFAPARGGTLRKAAADFRLVPT